VDLLLPDGVHEWPGDSTVGKMLRLDVNLDCARRIS